MPLRNAPIRNPGEAWAAEKWQQHAPVPIGRMTKADIERIEIFPGSFLSDDVIKIPPKFVAPPFRQASLLSLNVADSLGDISGLSQSTEEIFLLEIRRYLIASLWVPRQMKTRRNGRPKPSTWRQHSQIFFRLARAAREYHPSDESLFRHIQAADLWALASDKKVAPPKLLRDITRLAVAGAIQDWPPGMEGQRQFNVGRRERSRKSGGPRQTNSKAKPVNKYQPLPDDFLSELGWRCLWFVEELGPNIVSIMQRLVPLEKLPHKRRQREGQRGISQWRWCDSKGRPITDLPFELAINAQGSHSLSIVASRAQDITEPAQIRALAHRLQAAHALLIAISMVPRESEVLSFDYDSLERSGSGVRGIGATYKLSSSPTGTARDWPLHDTAVFAFDQQNALAEDLRAPGEKALFIKLIEGTGPDRDLSARGGRATRIDYQRLAKSLSTAHLLGGTRFHSHRIRKSMVRLIGLALVAAPKILMDLLGHKRIRMTLDYMLSDPKFAAEVEAVAKEIAALQIEEVLLAPERHGGKAGAKLEKFRQNRLGRRGEKALDAKDLSDAVATMSIAGQEWLLVRKGVFCTKPPSEAGPCMRYAGAADPGSCSPTCDHRLEDGRFRDQVDECIVESVRQLEDARRCNDELQMAFWSGQLRHHLHRFDELNERWKSHPTVKWLEAKDRLN